MLRRCLHKRTRDALLVLAAFASLLLAHADARAEVYWLDGYQVAITLKPERESFMLGEQIGLRLVTENYSDTEIELLWSSSAGRDWPNDYDVRVTGPDGKLLPAPEGSGEGRDGDSYLNTLVGANIEALGGVRPTYTGVSLKHWARPDKPGRYKVVLRRGVFAGPYKGTYLLSPETAKTATEIRLETEFTVVRGGEARIGKLIDELAPKMLECDRTPSGPVEAASRLTEIEDERVVGPLAEAIAKCKNPSIRYVALQAVAKFTTDEAFETLRAAAADPDEDFRTVVANKLSGSKHPKAYALVVSMRGDSYYGVRLMVLYALEHKNTERARRLIWEMTNDEHPLVRDEALRFLQQFSTPSSP